MNKNQVMRRKIATALTRLYDRCMTRSDILLLGNEKTLMLYATGEQAIKFQKACEDALLSGYVTMRQVKAWFRVLRIRFEQDSVVAKINRRRSDTGRQTT